MQSSGTAPKRGLIRRCERQNRGQRYARRFTARVFAVLGILLCTGLFSACARGGEEKGPEERTVSYSAQQMLLPVLSAHNAAEQVYTEKIWQIAVGADGRSYREQYLERLHDFFVTMEMMKGIAEERGIRLEAAERKSLAAAAAAFYDSSVRTAPALSGLSEAETETLFFDYALALALRESMAAEKSAEVSVDEAKVIRLQRIVAEDRDTAERLRERAEAGENFKMLASETVSGEGFFMKVSRGELSKETEQVVFSLEEDELSPVLEENGKYCIFKCTDSYDETETALRRKELQAERLQAVVESALDDYRSRYSVIMDEARWKSTVNAAAALYEGDDFFAAVKEGMRNAGV